MLKKSDEKEFHFIEHALEQLEDGGLLFSILPCSAMVKGGAFKKWRVRLLEHNTLLSVITFPLDLFYPQSQPPALAIVVKKGMKHPGEQKVLWIKVRNDGYHKVKGRRLKSDKVPDEMPLIKDVLRNFIANPNSEVANISEIQKASAIDFTEEQFAFELIPEAYLDATMPTMEQIQLGVDEILRDLISFLIRINKEELISE